MSGRSSFTTTGIRYYCAVPAHFDRWVHAQLLTRNRYSRADLEQNREMVRLDLDLPLPAPLDDLKIQPRYDELLTALEQCEFKSLLAEVKAEAVLRTTAAAATQGELF